MKHGIIIQSLFSSSQKIAESKGFEIVGGDTDSLFLLDIKSDNNDDKQAILGLISESKEKMGIDIEVNTASSKAVITKKKHYFGVTDKRYNHKGDGREKE
jgi:DNA polymerase elongation subunit (family B)